MKIVVIGGTGLIGSNVVKRLQQKGHDVVAASPRSGVNSLTGEGLAEALAGAQVVVDVANSPSFEDKAVLEFFQTSSGNLLAAEAKAGVKHHVALSIVNCDVLPDNGYFCAKAAQEKLIKAAGIPYTILRATQFFEFIQGIIDTGAEGDTVRTSSALFQPIASDDVSAALAEIAMNAPVNGTLEVGGPDRAPMAEIARQYLVSRGDKRQVIPDAHWRYFGSELDDRSLVAGDKARIGPTHYQDWLSRASAQR